MPLHRSFSISDVRRTSAELRRTGSLALVPTMGALHEGHLSLVRAARVQCSAVVVSIFINPLQFAPHEDLARYPRTMEADLELLRKEGVDVVFTPSVEEIYPQGAGATYVDAGEIGSRLDGTTRPHHFRGVTTVVAKLFHIVQPDFAFFGQKDAAQVAVLKAMVRDLNFPLELVVCPIVREPDGLAMSSRNRYLSAGQRVQALALSRALREGERAFRDGVHAAEQLQRIVLQSLASEPEIALEYLEIVDPDTLLPAGSAGPADPVTGGALLAIAARVGQTRLIDNVLLEAGKR